MVTKGLLRAGRRPAAPAIFASFTGAATIRSGQSRHLDRAMSAAPLNPARCILGHDRQPNRKGTAPAPDCETGFLFKAWRAHNKPRSGDVLICKPVFVKAQHPGKLHHRAPDSTVQYTHCKFDESAVVNSEFRPFGNVP